MRKLLWWLLVLALPAAAGDGVVIRAADKMILDRISLHKQNYVLPFTYREDQGSISQSELIFQLRCMGVSFRAWLKARRGSGAGECLCRSAAPPRQ